MNKLLLIIKREYLAKVRNKSFVIMTFLSPILMVAMVVLIAFLTQLNDSEKQVISILNESDFFHNEFVTTESTSFLEFRNVSLKSAIDSTSSLGYYGLLYIPNAASLEEITNKSFFYTKEAPSTSVLDKIEGVFKTRLQQHRLQQLGVSKQDFLEVDKTYDINLSTFSGDINIKGFNEIRAFIGGGFGYLIMMFIIIYGGFVMRSVIEEKTSRIIEVIISSVKPFQLMMGKIIGTSLAGLTQFAIWIFSASILMLIVIFVFDIDPAAFSGDTPSMAAMSTVPNVSMMNEKVLALGVEIFKIPWIMLISFFLVYFLLGYLIYSSIYAAIGAAVDNETDTQQFILPVITPLMLAIYVGFFSVFNNPHGPIAVAFSLFPLTSPIVMLMRLSSGLGEGGVPIWQVIVSILLLMVTFIGIVWLAAKIYRIGILMYGKKPSYRELYKWLKY
ncbi:ABC transporter permease [Cellulophaga sp. E16_2]|uniref:ABC transporter, permease protein, putative n=1 Tax=Cellulophaga algicola (strain DSM 14237 / IC166 / ACAM 630) TaxID=688270 RepID=E6XA23_CELAD|nr:MULTISPECIES: ABC transporter permease [Cellulophaga]ADV47713.1 ABC transporter, permease protein, putative [Cellulophaga algicola DSM 14237]MBO0590077.1 ABC transporter permease [Cellulophaga sp. E16_2]